MREEDYGKRGKRILLIIAVLLLAAALIVIVFDPFFHYHKPWFGLKPVQTRQQYQVNGALEQLDYDAVLLGSSVTMNINTTAFDEAYGCSTVKAVASGGACSTFAYYLNKAYKYRNLKYVFWGIDPDQLQYEAEEDPKQDQVEYLRDKNIINDVNYLWNVDVIFKEIPYMVTMSMHKDYDTGRAYDFSVYSEYGYDKAIGMYQPEGEVEAMKSLTGENYLAKREKNIDLIEELVAAHPETEYKFFFTVASILWWDIHYRDGGMERYFATFARLVERLEKYDNVTFYSGVFNDKDIIMDLSRYCDYCHADYEVNQLQAVSVINEERVITSENLEEEIDTLRTLIYEFEDRLLSEGGDWDFLREYEGCSR